MWWWEWKAAAKRFQAELNQAAATQLRSDRDYWEMAQRLRRIEEVLARHKDDLPPLARKELEAARKGPRDVGEIKDLAAFLRADPPPISVCQHPQNQRRVMQGGYTYCKLCLKEIKS